MKRECNIVRDILPLYIENMASEETKEFVEAHLSKCPECNELYTSMISNGEEEIEDEEVKKKIIPLKIVKQKLLCKRIVTSVIAAVLSVAILLGAGTAVYEYVDKQNKTAEIDYGTSEWYSKQDRMNAVNLIFREYINPMDFGYDVISIRYAGDAESLQASLDLKEKRNEANLQNIPEWNDCIVFYVALKTPSWCDDRILEPNTFYGNIKIVMMRNENDPYKWQMILVSIFGD